MPTIAQSEIPKPKSWEEFEDLVADLYTRRWNDSNTDRYGRAGQRQYGVDICGRPPTLGGRCAGVQCKRYAEGRLTPEIVEREVKKAESFHPPLAEYTIATTDARDAEVQSFVLALCEQREAEGKFPVHVVFWETLCSMLAEPSDREIMRKHYGEWVGLLPPETNRGVPYQAPRVVAEFVGRVEELARLDELLVPGLRVGITGLVGMGGLGKTELAKRAADRTADRFRDGVLWADCKEQGLGTIAYLWAGAYGVQLAGDDEASKVAGWRSLACRKEALLIFDDVQPKQDIEPLIPPRGRCAVLVTTRYGAHAALQGMARLDLETFQTEEAVALVDDVLEAGMAATQEEAALRLFELTGYLPLALDVALHLAKRCGWELAALNAELQVRGALQVLGDEQRLSKSLWATFEAAWDNLPAELQEVFGLLPVFQAGPSFSTTALAAAMRQDATVAEKQLYRLAGRSLVKHIGDERWGLHPLLGEFAETRGGLDELVWKRMAGYYVEVLKVANELYMQGGDGVRQGLALFDLERRHIEKGHAWATARAREDDEAEWLSGRYSEVGANVLNLRLHVREWIGWLEAAVEAAGRVANRRLEGVHLGNLGNAYLQLGQTRKAIEYYKRALRMSREIGDRRGEASRLANLGSAYADLGNTLRAIGYYEQALEISREIRDRRGEGMHLGNIGLAQTEMGDARAALGCYERALRISREIGDRQNEGNWLGNQGIAHATLGDARGAIECFEQALEIHREIGDRRGEGNDLGNLGHAHSDLGEVQQAIEFYEQALLVSQEIGNRRGEGMHLGNLGNTQLQLGNARRAIQYHEQALEISREIGDRHGEATQLGDLGVAHAILKNTARAINHHNQALEISRQIGDKRGEAANLGNLGVVYAGLGETLRAIEHYEQALEISRQIGDRRGEAANLGNMGRAYAVLGKAQRAKESLTEALVIFEEIEDPRAEQARTLLLTVDGAV